jgi:hypothetical protein
MPPKRKGLPKKAKKKSSALFDFLNDITWDKKNILNSDNKHAYSKFMITKFLSMHEPYLPIVDIYINKYQGSLGDEEFHKLCIALIPKKKVFLKYINGTPSINECKDKVKRIKDYFEISEREAHEYYQIAGDELVENIQEMYGLNE